MNLKKNTHHWAFVFGALGSGIAFNASAQNSTADARTVVPAPVAVPEVSTTDLLNLLVSEGVLSKEAAIRLVNTLRMRAERTQTGGNGGATGDTVVVPYIPPHVEARIAEAVKKELAQQVVEDAKREGLAAPDWVNNLRISGDVRVRYSGEYYPSDNPNFAVANLNEINDAGGTNGAGRDAFINVVDDRHRLLGRARVRLTAKPADDVEVGIRITSGNGGNPVSANQTLGRYGAKWESHFDLAYIQYGTSRVLLSGGRFENPWLSTDLVWDRDMTFEGLFAQVSPFRLGSENSFWNTYINLGAFPLQEIHQHIALSDTIERPDGTRYTIDGPDDKWLYSAGLGSEIKLNANHQLKLALTYHDYKNVTGIPNPPGSDLQNASASPFFQVGNVFYNIAINRAGEEQTELLALASEFELANFTTRYVYSGFDKYQLSFTADYVKNLAWDTVEVSDKALDAVDRAQGDLLPDRDTGYQLEMGFGTKTRSDRGDWGVSIAYRYLEGDAVLDAFADSDFLIGGTNAQGYIIKGQQFMTQNVWLELTLISADEVDVRITDQNRDIREDTVLLDLSARF